MSDIARVWEISTSTGLGKTPLHGGAVVVSGAEGIVVGAIVVVVVVVVDVVDDVDVVVEVDVVVAVAFGSVD